MQIILAWQTQQETNNMVSAQLLLVVFLVVILHLYQKLTVFSFSCCFICVLSSYPR